MERHEAARAARLELAAVVQRLKDECGIERQKVAAMLGLKPPMLSRVIARDVADRPTLTPPDGWRETLGDALAELGVSLKRIRGSL